MVAAHLYGLMSDYSPLYSKNWVPDKAASARPVKWISASENIGINRRPAWLMVRIEIRQHNSRLIPRTALIRVCVFAAVVVVVFFSGRGPAYRRMQDLMAANRTPRCTWQKTREWERLHR